MTKNKCKGSTHACDCMSCAHGKAYVARWIARMMMKYGWYVDIVTEKDKSTPTGFNAHTHGVLGSFKHRDLQIVLPLQPKTVNAILSTIVGRIKKGEKFEPGKQYDKILRGFPVCFIETKEHDRWVLRVILPNKKGELVKEKMGCPYHHQYDF